MKKKILVLVSLIMTLAMCTTAFAAGWQRNTTGWKYAYDDNNKEFYENCWQWIDDNNDGVAECYCFGPDGYMYADTTTPDGYTVDANGAWTINGEVQEMNVAGTEAVQPEEEVSPEEEAAPEEPEVSAEEIEEKAGEEDSEVGPSIAGLYYEIASERDGDYQPVEGGVNRDLSINIVVIDENTITVETISPDNADTGDANPKTFTKAAEDDYTAMVDGVNDVTREIIFTDDSNVKEITWMPGKVSYVAVYYQK